MKDIAVFMFMIGTLLCALSLTVHFLSFILEWITKRQDFKWIYFTYNVSWWIGFPLFVISIITFYFE